MWLLAMLAPLRVAPVALRAFDSASASWPSGGLGQAINALIGPSASLEAPHFREDI